MSAFHTLLAIGRSRQSGLLRLREATIPTRLECDAGSCGLCCSVMGSDITLEADDVEVIPPSALVKLGTEVVLKCNGSMCSSLENGSCTIYRSRPRSCREYPWYRFGDKLYFDAGCPGIRHDTDERPKIVDIKDAERFFGGRKLLTKLALAIFKLW